MKVMKCNSDFMIVYNLFKIDNFLFIKIFVFKDDGFVSDLLMICFYVCMYMYNRLFKLL